MSSKALRFCVLLLVLLGLLPLSAAAQEAPACPEGFSCPTITINNEALIGDFFLGDALLAAGVNSAALQIPEGRQPVIVRNIQEPGAPDFNVLYNYREVTVNVNLRSSQSRTYTASPRKEFIRGTLNFTCRVNNLNEGEHVACSLIVDGVPRGDVAPGQSLAVVLDPGPHVVQSQLVGDSAWLWTPGFWEGNVRISTGRTANARSQFNKQAHAIITLAEPGVAGDIYLNGELIAAQATTIDRWITPNTNYTLEIKNITDPLAGNVYRWREVSQRVYLRPGQERTINVRLTRERIPPPPGAVRGAADACYAGFDWASCANYQPAPRNCDEVVARGIPEQAAACCFPDRDRDKDGVACYGS